MKTILISTVLFFILSASKCKKEDKNCHHNIIIKNNSSSTVIFALPGYYNNLCFLSKRADIASGQQTELNLKYCWEDELSNGRTQDIYLVDTSNFNPPNTYYSCDSIEMKNTVLKHYVLTLEDLKKSNFTVTYP